MNKIVMNFRNDDVRDTLDESLIKMTEIFLAHRVPISHAVEPANVSTEVIEWLLEIKNKHPELVEVVQHGYSHKVNVTYKKNGKIKKGEFGYTRGYEEQYEELKLGMEMMSNYFGDKWFPAICFPFGSKNLETIKACNKLGFKIINDSVGNKNKQRLFYEFGRKFSLNSLWGITIPYPLRFKPRTGLFDLSYGLGPIRKFINAETECEFYSLDEWINQTNNLMSHQFIGNVLHHRYHNNVNSIDLIDLYLRWTKDQGIVSLTQSQILTKYGKS